MSKFALPFPVVVHVEWTEIYNLWESGRLQPYPTNLSS